MPMKVDNTNENPEYRAWLAELGNSAGGLPYYAFYIPGQKEPRHFPGVFATPGMFLETLTDGVEVPRPNQAGKVSRQEDPPTTSSAVRPSADEPVTRNLTYGLN